MVKAVSDTITLARVDDGVGIRDVTEYYAVSASRSSAPASWSKDVPVMTAANKYLWNYERISYTDDTAVETTKRVIGIYGDKGNTGATGNGIASVTNYYLATASASGVTTATSGWTTTVQSVTAVKKYLWNYETVTYTNKTTESTDPCIIGAYGDKGAKGDKGDTGETGNSLRTLITAYSYTQTQIDTFSATDYKGTWAVTSSVDVKTGDTVLLRIKNTTKNGFSFIVAKVTAVPSTTSVTTTSLGLLDKGETGATGADGNGVKSTVITYQAGSSGTTVPAGTWTTEVPKTTAEAPYLWTKAVITYTDGTKTTLYSVGSTPEGIVVGGRNYILYSKGNSKNGLFANFNTVTDEYAELSMSSKKEYKSIDLTKGFLLGGRDYTVGSKVTFSYDIMYTKWDFPTGTSIGELWFGQRYSSAPSGENATGTWRGITQHSLPKVGANGCKLNEWFHHKATLTIPEQASANVGIQTAIQFYNPNVDNTAAVTFRMKNVKLEYGNTETDWTPAPEDVENKLTEEINRAYTNFATTASDIMFEAVKEYVKTSDLEVFRKEISTQFTQTAESIEMTFNQVVQRIEDLTDDTNGEFSEIKSYIRFEDGNIILGKDDNPLILTLKNNRISFTSADQEVAYFSDNRMFVSNVTITTSADIVGLKITQDTDNIFIDW